MLLRTSKLLPTGKYPPGLDNGKGIKYDYAPFGFLNESSRAGTRSIITEQEGEYFWSFNPSRKHTSWSRDHKLVSANYIVDNRHLMSLMSFFLRSGLRMGIA